MKERSASSAPVWLLLFSVILLSLGPHASLVNKDAGVTNDADAGNCESHTKVKDW